ncbi:MAG TPA: sensor histidine kinase, partial [Nitrospirae bacterium]|nr:sensor histidine kinase [Nitrospirota bacterium]
LLSVSRALARRCFSSSITLATACTRFTTFSLRMIPFMWYFTVSSVISMSRAKVMELEKQRLAKALETERSEINHRIKNSLSTMASLVALKRARQKTKGAKEALADIECRFATIAELYSVLKLDARGELVHAPVFFHQIVSLVKEGFIDNANHVRMNVRCVDVELHPRDAFACGLIINELLSNCLKHAFPDGGGGMIDVSLERDGSSGLSLCVRDNGKGFNSHTDKGATSGLKLVDVLAKQLGGSMIISDSDQNGAQVRVDFPGGRLDTRP